MSRNIIGLIVSYIYVFGMIGVAEGLRKWRGYSVDFTRKVIHISVGMWAFGTVLLFDDRLAAIIPPITFVVINAISYRFETIKAMETGEEHQLGTVYFPIAFAVVVWFLWDQPALLVASLMPLTWGDALAAVVGSRYGRHGYSIFGSTRSWEGSLTMFLVSLIATAVPLGLLASPALAPGVVLGAAAATALGASIVEAISPKGIDNLTIPAASVLILLALLG